VISCHPAAETLICFKESETWELYGDSYLDFGQRRIDALYGMLQPRLAVNVEGAVFAWTNEGPRVFAPDGTSEGLEIPLELTLPEPFDLPNKGEDEYAFAVYMPVYRSIWWVFGKRVYSLYIRVAGDWKWGYQELGFTAMCGFRLPQSGWGLTEPPTGYPSSPSAGSITDTTIELTSTNNAQDGDESMEIWLKPGGGSWALHVTKPVSVAGTQAWTLTGLKAGWYYEVAVRYKRGPYYTFGYEASSPDSWPAGCKGSFTTTLASLPTIDSLVWYRASVSVEQVLVTITSPYTGTDYDVELRRGGGLVYTFSDITGTEGYYDQAISAEADNEYDCRLRTPYVDGAYTAAASCWGGPIAPTLTEVTSEEEEVVYVSWAAGQEAETEIYDSLPSEAQVDARDTLRYTATEGNYYHPYDVSGEGGKSPWIAIRHKLTQYGVTDYSDWDEAQCDTPIISP
jgi:hypothetical protein